MTARTEGRTEGRRKDRGRNAAAIDGGPAVSLPAFCFDCFRRRAAASYDPGGRDPGRACLPEMEIRTGGAGAGADRRRGAGVLQRTTPGRKDRETAARIPKRPNDQRTGGRRAADIALFSVWAGNHFSRAAADRPRQDPGPRFISPGGLPAAFAADLPADFRRDPSEDFRPPLDTKNRPEILQGRRKKRTGL